MSGNNQRQPETKITPLTTELKESLCKKCIHLYYKGEKIFSDQPLPQLKRTTDEHCVACLNLKNPCKIPGQSPLVKSVMNECRHCKHTQYVEINQLMFECDGCGKLQPFMRVL